MKEIMINTDTIRLDQLLKFGGITQTGGQSKQMVNSKMITVNGILINERGKKIKKGDIVEIKGMEKIVVI